MDKIPIWRYSLPSINGIGWKGDFIVDTKAN
ncbi:MAG: hypothetical protein K0Q56_913 [Sporolactobacillus laevolacticus]|jgi:hypothetical protein|nr:hypothetical protein [Sporolactobacillus laevolacticus]